LKSDGAETMTDNDRLAADITAQIIAKYVDRLVNTMAAPVKSLFTEIFQNFDNYIDQTYRRCCWFKIILNKEKPIRLDDIYVETRFSHNEKEFRDVDVITRLRDGEKIVVTGYGGCGKTIFMRHAWYSLFLEPEGKIAIYIELKGLNEFSTPDLQSYIRKSLISEGDSLSADRFTEICKRGRFIFILDGLDEVNHSIRNNVLGQISKMSFHFPLCAFAVSGRTYESFSALPQFDVFRVQPFELDQVEALIAKIDFDKNVKKKFLKKVQNEIWSSKAKTFLQTPLLCCMMLLTYNQFANIPEKMHIFYDYAFNVLFNEHDSTKDGFERQRMSKLNFDEMKRVISFFCLFTYVEKRSTLFNEDKFRENLQRAILQSNLSCSVDDLKNDMLEAVNIIYRDGLDYAFVHRSFQEYFVAYCISRYLGQRAGAVIQRIANRQSDVVLPMLMDMNQSLIEKDYLISEWDRYKAQISDLKSSESTDALVLSHIADSLSFYIHPSGDYIEAVSPPLLTEFSAYVHNAVKLLSVVGVDVLKIHFAADTITAIMLRETPMFYEPADDEEEFIIDDYRVWLAPNEDLSELCLQLSTGFDAVGTDQLTEVLERLEREIGPNICQKFRDLIADLDKEIRKLRRAHEKRQANLDELLGN
jgi:hypothetical protein